MSHCHKLYERYSDTQINYEYSDDEAMDCSIEVAHSYTLQFGKFKSQTLLQVATQKRGRMWLRWALKNVESLSASQMYMFELVLKAYQTKKRKRVSDYIRVNSGGTSTSPQSESGGSGVPDLDTTGVS